MQLTRFAAAVLNATATPMRHQAPRSGHVPMRMSLPCRSAATPTTSRNGDIKQSPRPAGSQADLPSACAAGPCEAARVTSASWIGVERHPIHLPLLRWTEPARCHHRVSIGPIQVGFSLPHESHCDSKAREFRLESEQEPPFGGTKRAPCLLCSRTRLRKIP